MAGQSPLGTREIKSLLLNSSCMTLDESPPRPWTPIYKGYAFLVSFLGGYEGQVPKDKGAHLMVESLKPRVLNTLNSETVFCPGDQLLPMKRSRDIFPQINVFFVCF